MRLNRAAQVVAAGAATLYAARSLQVALGSTESVGVTETLADPPFLSIVVPARNEERQIERCIRSLLALSYERFEIVAVDDRSDDATLAILSSLALEDDRLRVVRGAELPEGWVGKPWALAQGASAARGDWLLFTDADTIHEPASAVSAMAYARAQRLDVLSLLTSQVLGSFAERALLPSILWSIAFAIGPTSAMNDPKSDAALYNGQYILFRRAAYDALGGHAAVRDRIAEDFELARLVKRDGRFAGRLVGASDLVRTRMYQNAGEIWRGFQKNFALGAPNPLTLIAGCTLLACVAPLPEVLLARAIVRRRPWEAAAMLSAIVLTIATSEFGMRRACLPKFSGVFTPVGLTATIGIALDSAYRHASGAGVQWRGRTYGEHA